MLQEFLHWWAGQLLSLIPDRLRGNQGGGDGLAVLLKPGGAADLVLRRRSRDTELGRFTLDGTGAAKIRAAVGASPPQAILHVPPGQLLEQSVVLPLAAEREPEQVLRYEMDRLTPFNAEDLFWTWRAVRRDRARGQLHIQLSLALRAGLQPALDALATAGIRPVALQSGAASIPLGLNTAGPWRRRLDLGLALLCVVLTLTAVGAPFIRQSRELAKVERTIAASRPAANDVDTIRRRAAAAAAGVDVLAAQRAGSGIMLEILAALTTALPDDTVLSDLGIHARAITMTGQAASAARLIPALAASLSLQNPSFAAPVTRNETAKAEGFTIHAEAAP